MGILAGNQVPGTHALTLNTFYAGFFLFSGASSVVANNNLTTTGDAGTTAWAGQTTLGYEGCVSGAKFVGNVSEVGFWASSIGATDRGNLSSNQRTYWGI